jgi:hypothetical protein
MLMTVNDGRAGWSPVVRRLGRPTSQAMPGCVNTGAPSNGSRGEDCFEEELVEPCPLFPLREVR